MGYCKGNSHLLTDGCEINKNDYMCCQMLMPEKDIYYFNDISGMKVHCNRFSMWTNLSQHFYVEQLSRFIDSRLDHHRKLNDTHFKRHKRSTNNNEFEGSDSDDDDDDDDDDNIDSDDDNDNENNSKKTILGECITGSQRHLKNLSLNAMHIVQKKGKPHIFLTLTSDSNWPEIHEKIHKSQTAFNRPDVTNMVFHGRTEALLHNLRQGKYFKFTIDILNARQYITVKDPITDCYTGQYNDVSQYNGYGKLEQTTHNLKVIYTGSWQNGTRHGHGELIQPYNVNFTGEFKDNLPNGQGCLTVQRTKKYTDDYEVVYSNTSKMIISTVVEDDKSFHS